MSRVLHGRTRTTEAVCRAVQHRRESLEALAKHDGINPKTIANWRARTSAGDQQTGRKNPCFTVLSLGDKAIIVASRRHTLLCRVSADQLTRVAVATQQ